MPLRPVSSARISSSSSPSRRPKVFGVDRALRRGTGAAVGDDTRSARILALRAGVRLLEAMRSGRWPTAEPPSTGRKLAGDPTVLAQLDLVRGPGGDATTAETTSGLLERGVEIEVAARVELEWNWSPSYVLGRRLMRFGETDRARVLFERVEAQAASRGDEVSPRDGALVVHAVEWLAGRWSLALEHAGAALRADRADAARARTSLGRDVRRRSSKRISVSSRRRAPPSRRS